MISRVSRPEQGGITLVCLPETQCGRCFRTMELDKDGLGKPLNKGSSDFSVDNHWHADPIFHASVSKKAVCRRSEKPQAPSNAWSLWQWGDAACVGVGADFPLLALRCRCKKGRSYDYPTCQTQGVGQELWQREQRSRDQPGPSLAAARSDTKTSLIGVGMP